MIFSYAMPIVLRLVYGFQHSVLPPGPFTLGRWGVPVNGFAACWCVYLIIFTCFPSFMPVTKENMNYASLIFGACLILTAVTWLTYGRTGYRGVLAEDGSNALAQGSDSMNSGSTKEQDGVMVDHSSGHEKQN
jgi:hypothetical protein